MAAPIQPSFMDRLIDKLLGVHPIEAPAPIDYTRDSSARPAVPRKAQGSPVDAAKKQAQKDRNTSIDKQLADQGG